MADEVATVSSSPALGFSAVVISNQSYSGLALRRPARSRLVDEPDRQSDKQPLAEPACRVGQGHFLPDAHRAVVHAREVRRQKQSHDDAELQALCQTAPALIAFRVDPGR